LGLWQWCESHRFFSDSDPWTNILTQNFLNSASHCFHTSMFSGWTCTTEKSVAIEKSFFFAHPNFFSDSKPAKTADSFGFGTLVSRYGTGINAKKTWLFCVPQSIQYRIRYIWGVQCDHIIVTEYRGLATGTSTSIIYSSVEDPDPVLFYPPWSGIIFPDPGSGMNYLFYNEALLLKP
jgi:hypothetical protein